MRCEFRVVCGGVVVGVIAVVVVIITVVVVVVMTFPSFWNNTLIDYLNFYSDILYD